MSNIVSNVDKIKTDYDIVIIGGGPAGIAAAVEASKAYKDVLLLERNNGLGGILNQCIHNGFGLQIFKEELTGPEYAEKYAEQLVGTSVTVLTNAMVFSVEKTKKVSFIHPRHGVVIVKAKAIIVATGCRERTRGAIGIAGSRPSGVFTAGAAQLFVNINGKSVGKKVVILGSGDIGLIMARRMTLEGATVVGVYEVMSYSGGLASNIVRCLNDFNIPLHLSHTIVEIRGTTRVEAVVIAKVDDNRIPIVGTEQVVECDTVLLSVGLIPENELNIELGVTINPRTNAPVLYDNMETSVEGVFACGNVAQVHDIVDFVSQEGVRAACGAVEYVKQLKTKTKNTAQQANTVDNVECSVIAGDNIGYVVPAKVRLATSSCDTDKKPKIVELFFRVSSIFGESTIIAEQDGVVVGSFKRPHLAPGEMEKIILLKDKLKQGAVTIKVVSDNKHTHFEIPTERIDERGNKCFVCTVCPKGCNLIATNTDTGIAIQGNACPRGDVYGKQEAVSPMRVVTSTVRVDGKHMDMLPVKTNAPIPKNKVADAMKLLDTVIIKSNIHRGDVVLKNILGLNVDFVASKSITCI